ncbi:Nitrite facilitator 2 [Raoultella planticola]|uniref:Nitrite facilitator 2 n=1 Tax=Raoultella planticola TaxID=575 RepID=A0A485AGY2_RAOPL|nr:Nitrite facilitator 2 [Raoultella planticola]
MSRESEKDNHYLLKGWRPENPAFWKIKAKPLREEILLFSELFTSRLLRMDVIQRGCG